MENYRGNCQKTPPIFGASQYIVAERKFGHKENDFGEKVTEGLRIACYNEAILKRNKNLEVSIMKYVCDVCGWEYDEAQGYPEAGIAPGTKWEDVPEDFECPLCFVGKDQFSKA